MKVIDTAIADVKIIEPKVFGDERGFFFESFNERTFRETIGVNVAFVQDNHSKSVKGVLRGLHYQVRQPQGKLVRVVAGEVFDVAVDIRRQSPSFGKHVAVRLSADNKRMLWVPPGFAHGYFALSDMVDFLYKCTDVYSPSHERTLAWNDPAVGIEWPLPAGVQPKLSAKDLTGQSFADIEKFA